MTMCTGTSRCRRHGPAARPAYRRGRSLRRGYHAGRPGSRRAGPLVLRGRSRRQLGSLRRRRLRASSSAPAPSPSSNAEILTSIAVGEPVKGKVPTRATLSAPRVTLIPPTSTASKRLVTVIACVGVLTVRVNLPLSSGENDTFDACPVSGSVTVQLVPLSSILIPFTCLVPPSEPKMRSASVPSVQLTCTVNCTSLGRAPSPVTAFVTDTLPVVPALGYELVTVNNGVWLVVTLCAEFGLTVTSVGGGVP